MKTLLLNLLFLSFCYTALSQSVYVDSLGPKSSIDSTILNNIPVTAPDSIAKIKKGTFTENYPLELDTLLSILKNNNINNCPKLVKGFRVQIYSCSGANCQVKAEKNYNQFLIAYPHIATYMIWDAPSHKVRVGNCRNRFEAEAIKEAIKEDFPFIFIVPDFIETPFIKDCAENK